MTAKEFVELCALPEDTSGFLKRLAAIIPSARLSDGQRLNDATDFIAWLREVAEAAETDCKPPGALHATCPRCGHIHRGKSECEEPIGGERICRCEM